MADASQVIDRAAEVVRSAASALAMEPGEVALQTDPAGLEQAVWKLMNNAVQATPDDGHVDVRSHTAGGAAHRDRGSWQGHRG